MLRSLFSLTGDQLFLAALDHALSLTPVILAVLAARWLLRELPRRLSVALWLVVFLRLLVPVTVESDLGLLSQEPVIAPGAAAGVEVSLSDTLDAARQVIADSTGYPVEVRTAEDTQSLSHSQVWLLVGSRLWPAGMAAMALYSLISLLRLKKRLVGAAPGEGRVWLCDGIDTPFLLGVLRPRVYLPSGLSEGERESILAHERSHIRHLDPAARLLAWVGLCVYWFHPLVWVSFLLLTADMEAACDEDATAALPADRRADYADTLLRLSTGRHSYAAAPLAFGEGSAKGRIRRILRFEKPGKALRLTAAALVVLLGFYLVAQRSQEPHLPGNTYVADEVLYQAPGAESGRLANFPYLAIVSDDWFLALRTSDTGDLSSPLSLFDGIRSGIWDGVGQFRSTELTRKELLARLPTEDGWTSAWRPGRITDARVLQREDGPLCLFLQTSAGDTLLAVGDRADTGGRIQYLYRLRSYHPFAENSDGIYSYRQLDVAFQLRQQGLHPQFLYEGTASSPTGFDMCCFRSKEEGGLGFANWQRDGDGYYRLIGLHYYGPEELAACELAPGCYLAPDPMLARPDDPGVTLYCYDICDVLFICNESVASGQRIITLADGSSRCTCNMDFSGLQSQDFPHLTWFDRQDTRHIEGEYTISYRFYDRDGNEII